MTKKHFKAVSEILKAVRDQVWYDKKTVDEIASRLADYFSKENQRFDVQKFLTASGDSK